MTSSGAWAAPRHDRFSAPAHAHAYLRLAGRRGVVMDEVAAAQEWLDDSASESAAAPELESRLEALRSRLAAL